MSLRISDEKLLVFASLINFPFKISLIDKLYQTLVTVFHQNTKNLEVRQKYSATRRTCIFNSLLGVWYVMSLVFDILRNRRSWATDGNRK